MRKSFFAFLIVFFFIAGVGHAYASTGFVGNPIWIYPEFPREGESVTLTALFHNGEVEKLTGTVLFFDNDTLLGKKTLTISPGSVGTAQIVFKMDAGNHVFSATAQGFQEISNTGSTTAYALPLGKAQLPNLFVTKNGSGTGVDAVGLKASAEAGPVLDKVNQIQDKVISAVPEPVASSAESLDAWRASTADDLQKSVVQAQKNVDDQKKIAADQKKKTGKVSPSTQYVDTPFAIVKLFFTRFFLYIFSHGYLFYITFFGAIYFIARFIFNKIKQRRNNRKVARKVSNKFSKE